MQIDPLSDCQAIHARNINMKTAASLAKKTLYPGDDPNPRITNPHKTADKFENSLIMLDKLSGQIAEQHPRQRAAARVSQQIAQTALQKGKDGSLSHYRRLGTYQAALEVISGLDKLEGWNLAQAAHNVHNGPANLQVLGYQKPAFHYAKDMELLENGMQFLKLAAGAMNHHSALAILALGENETSTLKALEAAGRQKNDRIDLELLGSIARETSQAPRGPVEEYQSGELASSLKLLGELAPLARQENPRNAAELNLLEKMARQSLKNQPCRVVNHKPHFYSSTPHEMDDYCRMGKYQGTLAVMGSINPDCRRNPSARAASRVLAGKDQFQALGDKKKNSEKIQYHLFEGGCYAIRDLAEAVGDEKALKLMQENLPGESLLEELKNLPGKKTEKP